MKFKGLKFLFFASLGLCGVTMPSLLTSCSSIETQKLKLLDLNAWGTDGTSTTYSSLKYTDVSIKDAIYGSNYNDGNYIFLYGTAGNSAETKLPNFIYGNSGNDGTGNNKVDMDKNMNFSSSPFLNDFFRPNQGVGNGLYTGLGVSILMYVDYAPYNPNASSNIGLSGAESPLAKYTSEEVLKEWQTTVDESIIDVKDLPDEAKAKINTYKRKDQSAIIYRELINYINDIRPNSELTSDGGMIAFKKGANPKVISMSDATQANTTLKDYYKPK